MKNFENYITSTIEEMDELFEDIESLFYNIRVNVLNARYNPNVDSTTYCQYVEENFKCLEDCLNKSETLLNEATGKFDEFQAKNQSDLYAMNFSMINLTYARGKHNLYVEMFEKFQFIRHIVK